MTTEKSVLEFACSQIRTITRHLEEGEPESQTQIKSHYLFIPLKSLPLTIPTTPNPRQPNLLAKPCKQMMKTLEEEPERFTDYNRGLLLIADKVHFVHENGDAKKIIVDFGVDEEGIPKGGLVDGGHTYAVLKEKIGDESLAELPIFVTIIEGVTDFASPLARARNTSVQVKENSMANLEEQFEPIKQALGDYNNKVIYYENENLANDGAAFPIEELVGLMTALNTDIYGKDSQPTIVYTGVSTCLNKWMNKKNRSSYEKLYPLLPSIVELYEYLYTRFEDYAKEAGMSHVGKINGVEKTRGRGSKRKAVQITLPFTGEVVGYRLSKGFSMPVFAALRFLLIEKEGKMEWATEPKKFLDDHAGKLFQKIFEAHQKEYGSNPNKTGKSTVLWQNIANAVIISSLEERLLINR